MIPRTFDPKAPTEVVVLTFDYTKDLRAGETLTGTPTTYISLHKGDDAGYAAVVSGAPQIDATSKKVLQQVQGGVLAVDYLLYTVCATNQGRNLECYGVLPVRRIY
ncbi:MAG: hypothetical protein AB1513_08925 [Pseudomonadota bacterium]